MWPQGLLPAPHQSSLFGSLFPEYLICRIATTPLCGQRSLDALDFRLEHANAPLQFFNRQQIQRLADHNLRPDRFSLLLLIHGFLLSGRALWILEDTMTSDESMVAVAIEAPGGPEVLKPVRLPLPQPEAGQILVKVAAAGVNRPDVLQRKGGYPPPPGAPSTPGLEVAGKITAKGPATSRFAIGDEVAAIVPGGGYAEYCVVAETNAMPVPAGLSLIEAGALPETFMTVWTNVFERGSLKPGESLLVHGGSSGIGTTAIMLAKAFGSRVFATAGSHAKCRACESLGAERAINYRNEDFVEVVASLTDGRGVDVVLDMVGGDYIARNIAAAARDGRIVSIAFLKGSKAEIDFLPMMLKRLTLSGSTLRPRTVAEKASICRALEDKVWPLLASGQIRPQIYKTFALKDSALAHALMESSQHIGKIMLVT
jgi:NADPH2:quinone reductase